jgi:hypothetical protein
MSVSLLASVRRGTPISLTSAMTERREPPDHPHLHLPGRSCHAPVAAQLGRSWALDCSRGVARSVTAAALDSQVTIYVSPTHKGALRRGVELGVRHCARGQQCARRVSVFGPAAILLAVALPLIELFFWDAWGRLVSFLHA